MSRNWLRRVAVLLFDGLVVSSLFSLSFWIRFDGDIPELFLAVMLRTLPMAFAVKVAVFALLRVDRISWRYVGRRDFGILVAACGIGSIVLVADVLILRAANVLPAFPRSVLGIDFALCLLAVGGARFLDMMVHDFVRTIGRPAGSRLRAVIIGAGDAGVQLARALSEETTSRYRLVGFLDDDSRKHGRTFRGVRVLGPRSELPRIAEEKGISSVLIAMPSALRNVIRETVEIARSGGVRDIRIIPHLSELYSGTIGVSDLRSLEPGDVLQRHQVTIDHEPIRSFLGHKAVLVTGAAGSIGSELCRLIVRYGADRLIAHDTNETGLFDLEEELLQHAPRSEVEIVLGDIRDSGAVGDLFERTSPNVVYHAAAYKHVPLMERFPSEAVKTNVIGTRNVVDAASATGCEAMIQISTDKAVNPASVLGASKRVAEMIIREQPKGRTRCMAVRFGNVLGSRGSVLRTFQKQVEQRRSVTVTDSRMRRFFMVATEAAQLVLQASAVGAHGQVLLLDMGDLVRVADLASDVIRFYGLEPDIDIPIVYTGIRPGEKLVEELLTEEEGTMQTEYQHLRVARIEAPPDGWREMLAPLVAAAQARSDAEVVRWLRELVPAYARSSQSGDVLG